MLEVTLAFSYVSHVSLVSQPGSFTTGETIGGREEIAGWEYIHTTLLNKRLIRTYSIAQEHLLNSL